MIHTMPVKRKHARSARTRIKLALPPTRRVNLSSSNAKEELTKVKEEIRTVMAGANVDSEKLSLNFTI